MISHSLQSRVDYLSNTSATSLPTVKTRLQCSVRAAQKGITDLLLFFLVWFRYRLFLYEE